MIMPNYTSMVGDPGRNTMPEGVITLNLAYFNQVHPVYPFLDRAHFESQALGPGRDQLLKTSTAFSALYHTVLALGCQYQEGGTFDPGKGTAWRLYQISLGLLTDILVPREALANMQVSCFEIAFPFHN